ncbi:MAG TPA: hypothetical protein VFV02_17345 [Acidimicrobiales bacterium]|nr:hypothetical protein [Acidimicrobiales bacterium]
MTPSSRSTPVSLTRDSIRVGALLAEGGEGRVFELPLQPHLVFKEYRRAADRTHLEELIRWPDSGDPRLLSRVRSSASWPEALVERGGPDRDGADDAIGVVVARAPRRFSVRHRDGSTRLATLSYLTADPAYREVAYGISLPPPFTTERLGLVYALARVLEAFETLEPRVGHGDLSAKNVLWSLQRGPEVFLIDCDNSERYGPDGLPLSAEGRRRAMTPNWDDPAVSAGTNPELSSDRYSLALIFLRVVGAANFPVQARQRQGGSISIDFPIPPGYAREVLLGPGSPLWDLCARGLTTEMPAVRPSPGDWVAALEAVLDGLGAAQILHSVWSSQGGGPALAAAPVIGVGVDSPTDVSVRPVIATSREPPPKRLIPAGQSQARLGGWSVAGAAPAAALPTGSPGLGAGSSPGISLGAPGSPAGPPGLHTGSSALSGGVAVASKWWLEAHRSLFTGSGRGGRDWAGETLRRLALCAAVDLALALFGLFLVAMAVAPILGL